MNRDRRAVRRDQGADRRLLDLPGEVDGRSGRLAQARPILIFRREAIEFYKKTVGAEVVILMRVKDSPESPQPGMVPPGCEDKIMHSCLRIGDSMVMASDGRCEGALSFRGFLYRCSGE